MASTPLDHKLSMLKEMLDGESVWYKADHQLKYETYFKTGGVVKVFVCPQGVEHFLIALRALKQVGLSYKIIGQTTNLMMFDEVVYSVIVSTRNLQGLTMSGDALFVESGYSLQDFVRVALTNGGVGFEGLEGIPGSVGGGLYMNAGAYGYTVSDNLLSVRCVTPSGDIVDLPKDECGFKHRKSVFKENDLIILGASFQLRKGDVVAASRSIEMFHIARHSYQEFVYPNLGSLFSISGGVYSKLFGANWKYGVAFGVLKVVLKNPVSKFLARKRPENIAFNRLFESMVGRLPLKPSPKSINILINDGAHSSVEMYKYVSILRRYLPENVPIENEFVVEPCYATDEEFKSLSEIIKNGGAYE